ncbi:MAG: prolyl oligopeptidase family serine peptidase [Oscillospiraceae bacterium]|nr:prolyl oligopeptidase family serine peptidase [Oscillospiraceae bacterium]
MKKTISVLLSVLVLLSCIGMAFSAGAISEKEGLDALRAQFKSGEASLDYVYYDPTDNNKSGVKYPLVVLVHGNGSGDYPGHQLDNCDIAYWASDEYQARFKNDGGAFLLLPRCQTGIKVAWDDTYIKPLKKTIDAFVREHKDSIDTNRIYIGGYSMGGKMTIRMISTYPDYFAAAFPHSPTYNPSSTEIDKFANVPVWFCVCKNDTYPSLSQTVVKNNWNYLSKVSAAPERNRMSTFGVLYYPDGTVRTADGKNETHNTRDAVCHDLFMNDKTQFKDMTVVDGTGKEIHLTYPDGLISWMSEQSLENRKSEENNSNFFAKIYNFFKNLINMIFSIFN